MTGTGDFQLGQCALGLALLQPGGEVDVAGVEQAQVEAAEVAAALRPDAEERLAAAGGAVIVKPG